MLILVPFLKVLVPILTFLEVRVDLS